MSRFSRLISNFNETQNQYGYLQSIDLNRDINEFGGSSFNLNIILCPFPCHEGSQRLAVKFYGVRDLKIGELDGLLKLLINICDISEQQMENINLKVKEDENELLSFYSKTFEYEII